MNCNLLILILAVASLFIIETTSIKLEHRLTFLHYFIIEQLAIAVPWLCNTPQARASA